MNKPESSVMVLVPREPTHEMMLAVDDAYGDGGDFPDMWEAAIAAAPTRPTAADFEAWLRTVCFQKPTPEAYDLAKCAWRDSRLAAHPSNQVLPEPPHHILLQNAYDTIKQLLDAHWTHWLAHDVDLAGVTLRDLEKALAAPAASPQAVPLLPPDAMDAAAANGLAWAVSRWQAEVSQRPLVNKHRRSLDDVWRQVIRYFGGDPVKLLGPPHDELWALGQTIVPLSVPSEQPIAEQPKSEQPDSVYLGSAGPSEDLQTALPEDTRDASGVPPGEWGGLSPKQAWWAGYRVGKGLPPEIPRSEAVRAPTNHQGE